MLSSKCYRNSGPGGLEDGKNFLVFKLDREEWDDQRGVATLAHTGPWSPETVRVNDLDHSERNQVEKWAKERILGNTYLYWSLLTKNSQERERLFGEER